MSANNPHSPNPFFGAFPPINLFQQAMDYFVDACQRQTIYLDTLRKRGNTHLKQEKSNVPNVLFFDYEIVIDGRTMEVPVNYMLLRILSNKDTVTDPTKRPLIVFDPRGGHGLGISGMKEESVIGLALRDGYPCYLVGFLPEPIPGQTIESTCRAEAYFMSKVAEMHPKAEKPCLIGNCQAGWQIAMIAAMKPDATGALILAAAPISFWSGIKGRNPIRYTGGLYGGAWATAFASDIGNGIFDGAMLVQGFESANPSYSIWNKHYNLYAKIDTETQRFLDFEKWWSAPALFNKEEMTFITEDLFMGNRLTMGEIHTADGRRVDLRNIKAPIVIMCSNADEIVSPQQALGWILDVYEKDADIAANKQTIVYSMHQNIGHLGIFVSGAVATKEHSRLMNSLDAIKSLPPGLYEAVIIEKAPGEGKSPADFIMKLERRTLEDIKKIGFNNQEDDLMFTTAARISENLHGIYQSFASPMVRFFATKEGAELARKMHGVRTRYWMLSDLNPLLLSIAPMAEAAKKHRLSVPENNIFWVTQDVISKQIEYTLDIQKKFQDSLSENLFMSIYGNPFIQAMVGICTKG